jgi:hypothetical protein
LGVIANLNAAINGSILAGPDACFVMTMALPFGSTRAFATAHAISRWPQCRKLLWASLRFAVLMAPRFQPCDKPL